MSETSPPAQTLAAVRAALCPPMGLSPLPVSSALPTGSLLPHTIQADARQATLDYRADRYDQVATVLPTIIGRAQRAVAEHRTPETLRARASACQLAGRYLTQVHALDLATVAMHTAIDDAQQAGDRTLAVAGVIGHCWLLIRQERLAEAQALAVTTAEEVEPSGPGASPHQWAAWGNLLLRGAAAAVRRGDTTTSQDLMAAADHAATQLDGADVEIWGVFGALTVACQSAEHALILDRPQEVLERSQRLPEGEVPPQTLYRHHLDVAAAHLAIGDRDGAVTVLYDIHEQAPQWLGQQHRAHALVAELRDQPSSEEQRRRLSGLLPR